MTLHSMELPSINSATSISDNAELRNYYDNLLFKNSSGRSLADLPRKAQEIIDKNSANSNTKTNIYPKVDFIKGFSRQSGDNNNNNNSNLDRDVTNAFAQFKISANSNNNSGSTKQSSLFQDFTQQQQQQTTLPPRRQSIFNIDSNNNNTATTNYPITNSNNSNNNNSPVNTLAFNFNNNNTGNSHFMNDFNVERRSSYISDNLIHNQQQLHEQNQFPHLEPLTYQQSPNNNYNNNNSTPTQQFYYNNINNNNNNSNPKYGYLNYVNGQISQQRQNNYNKTSQINKQEINNNNNNNNINNGLILTKEKQLASSEELAKLYKDCGKYYFSSQQVYDFTDYLKKMLNPDFNFKYDSNLKDINKPLIKFLNFLKNCNLNYNPQSDGFISQDRTKNINNNILRRNSVPLQTINKTTTASAYLHYRPLVLVSLKNGKLELLSMPSGANMAMKRGDLVIIDGDRGKDLTLVVEPVVSLDMALIINFLKKKIHFDSLITSKKQHYPNDYFIQELENCTNGISDSLDPKLYDIIELTQLIVPSKQVLRYATSWESSTNLHNKFQDELKALHIAQLKLRTLNSGSNDSMNMNDSMNLNIKILNAEFQFDRKKLTFYYICEERNDFRELIKELFKFYKTRIWLCAIPNDLEIDTKYYDKDQKEVKMYQDMMQHFTQDDIMENNSGFVVAPPLNELKLDNFQIAVYKELVQQLF